MVELKEQSAFDGLDLPMAAGGVTVVGVDRAEMVSVSPRKGLGAKVSAALKQAVGVGLTEIGRAETAGDVTVIWTGRGQWFVAGPVGTAQKLTALADTAGMTGQADGWAVAHITGKGASDVLARLCPLDLEAMQLGDAARSDVQHMQSVVRRIEGGFEVMVFRSMARTLIHDLKGALTSVAAQNTL